MAAPLAEQLELLLDPRPRAGDPEDDPEDGEAGARGGNGGAGAAYRGPHVGPGPEEPARRPCPLLAAPVQPVSSPSTRTVPRVALTADSPRVCPLFIRHPTPFCRLEEKNKSVAQIHLLPVRVSSKPLCPFRSRGRTAPEQNNAAVGDINKSFDCFHFSDAVIFLLPPSPLRFSLSFLRHLACASKRIKR